MPKPQAIATAELITLGPGSLYTSLIPNLLVRGLPEALAKSRAAKIYICNLMTQPGETTHFSAADHLRAIHEHCGKRLFDYVLVNNAPISPSALKRYRAQRSEPVAVSRNELEQSGARVVEGNFISEKRSGPAAARWVRHDSGKLAAAVIDITANHHYWADDAQEPSTEKDPGK